MKKEKLSPEQVAAVKEANDKLFLELKTPMSKKDKEVLVEQTPGKVVEVVVEDLKTGDRQGVVAASIKSLGATPESSKLKLKMLSKKPNKAKKEKLPSHIRKAYITINDKSKNEPITISFNGEWTGSDINLAGKHLILEYNVYVRDRAIRGK